MNWPIIYIQETDLDKYLRSSGEQRKLQSSVERNNLIKNMALGALGGAFAGARVGSAGGLQGALIGSVIGFVIGIAGFFTTEIKGLFGPTYEQREEARQKDLANGFTPSVPSNLATNYIFGVGTDDYLRNDNILGIKCLVLTSYNWENNLHPKRDNLDTQRLLFNLINYGEKCQKYFREFNFLQFVAKNKTDQNSFFIMAEQVKTVYYSNWSKIFSKMPEIFATLMTTGLRFNFQNG